MTTICLPTPDAPTLLGEVPPEVEVLVWDGTGAPPDGIERVDMVVAKYALGTMPSEALARMPRLRVIQLLTAGVEPWLPMVPAGVALCSGRGVHGSSTAELAIGGMISVLRQFPYLFGEQAARRWTDVDTDGLAGKRVLILGAGDIGQRIASAVLAFDAHVTFVARRLRPDVHTLAELPQLLPNHDVVAIALPHTPETHRLVDASFLAAMPDGALLVNIARGSIVDTDALVTELRGGRLRAFLDVTDPEPLPPDHPLWQVPNLVLTPHIGGGTRGWERRAYALVREQVLRLHRDEPLRNVVTAGY